MARVFGTIAVSRIQGRSGEIVYKRWKSGVLVAQRQPTSVRNPNSIAQMVQRGVFSVFAKQWFTLLTAPERTLWNTYALTKPGFYVTGQGVRQLIGSNGGAMSGQNAYCLVNAWLISAGLLGVTIPPTALPAPTTVSDLAGVFALGVLTLTWTSTVAEVGAVARIWVASASGLFHKQIIDIPLDSLGTSSPAQLKGAKGEFMNLTDMLGEHLYFQLDGVNPTGGKSAGSNTIELEII